MAALDFPANPTDGQAYGSWIYSTSKGAWKAKPLTPGQAQISATAPANPNSGDQWYNSNDGVLYIYYNDGNTSQWVESRSAITSDGYYSPNYIINGAFDIWQRGTTFTNVADGSHTADRWYVGHNGSGLRTVSQQAFSLGSSPAAGQQGNVFFRYQQTSAGTGSIYSFISQRIEDVRTLSEKVVTVSFWAKADTAGRSFNVYFDRFYGTGGSSPEYGVGGLTTINLTTAWARYSVTTTLPTLNGKTIGANSYLALTFDLNKNVAQTIDLWGVQLEEGAVATPFRRNANSIQGELAACQRYYMRFVDVTGVRTVYGNSVWQAPTVNNGIINLPVQMRRIPTVTGSSAGALLLLETGVAWRPSTSITQDAGTNQNCIQLSVGTSSTAGYAHASQIAVQSGQYIEVNAEL